MYDGMQMSRREGRRDGKLHRIGFEAGRWGIPDAGSRRSFDEKRPLSGHVACFHPPIISSAGPFLSEQIN
jgi:hypothetical protein